MSSGESVSIQFCKVEFSKKHWTRKQCGEKYYTAKVSKGMNELVRSQAVERTLQVPVKRFKEAYAI